MRRLSFVVLLALFASLMPAPHSSVYAASFRTFVAQVPSIPGTGSVRVWMNSDTALGETAGIEYNVGSSYIKVLGTYDTSFPGANWRADIPGQAAGTLVRYQLFTRNQSGEDYGFSGFNWSYTTSAAQCAGAIAGDNNVFYAGLFHDSFSGQYRAPLGPVTANQGTVTMRFRTCASDVQGVTLRVWDDRANQEVLHTMTKDGGVTSDPNVGPVQLWKIDLPIPTSATIFYYTFRATDGTATGYYRDDDPKFLGGGFGQAESSLSAANDNSYQLTVFKPTFSTPEWMQRAVIYQIFPDRFRDGDSSNNPQAGRFSYDRAGGAIVRSNGTAWNTTVCDPRDKQGAGFNCTNYYGDNFYGGDLKGITQKIQDGYFSSLGVTVLYLNPIFLAPSNHKYDTADFLRVDPDFGTLQDFKDMIAAAEARGIKVMLDGVFNHTSSDSPYFDYYKRYDANSTLTSPNGPGTDDNSGACEGSTSSYYSWFYFGGSYGGENGGSCNNGVAGASQAYRAWYGYGSLPKIDSSLPQVRQYFYGTADGSDTDSLPDGVGPYWTKLGASGWRFDVGADVDPGLTNDAGNSYWEQFRAAVRNELVTGRGDTVMLGEEWGDGTPWLLGDEWDSVMNYRFRSAVLSWLFTGCSGNGCSNSGAPNAKFQENDSNDSSSSGSIAYLSPSQFNARLRSIQEDYPANAFNAMMNLAGSHDTQRVRFLLKKVNNNNDDAAVQRMKEWWLFAFTYAGAPTLYYGDEVGLSHDGVWDGSQFQDDPYNRAPFPWADASGSAYSADADMQAFARFMASLRHSYRALQDGDVQHGLVIDDAKQLYGFARTNGQQTALVLLNRSNSAKTAAFTGLNAAPYNLPNGSVLVNALSGEQYTVSGGAVEVSVSSNWGAVLIEKAEADTPAVVGGFDPAVSGADVSLGWSQVTRDSASGVEVAARYEIFRGTAAGFAPSDANKIATVGNPTFGGDPSYTDSGAATGGYFYIVRACNAAGACSTSPAASPRKQSPSLIASAATGTYGDSVTLQASLSAAGVSLFGRSVSFSLNGTPVGTATTNAAGVATLADVGLSGINAGTYASGVTASFAGEGAYNPTNSSNSLKVEKAATTTTVTCEAGATYTGAAQTPCTATVTGPSLSQSLSVSYANNTDAGTASANASYSGGANYLPSGDTASFTIAKAATTTTITCPTSVEYTGSPRTPCTAAATGPGLSQSLSVSYANNTGVGTASASASYPGGANYEASSGSTTFAIGMAGSTTTITCEPGATYTGAAQTPCTATVTGPGGLSETLVVSYENNINAGTATARASYPGDANRAGSSASVEFTIAKAATTTTVTCEPGATYTGAAQTPCTATVTGPSLSQSLSVSYVDNTDAGTASANASYSGGANYLPSGDTASFTIAKAATITTVTCPTSVEYSGAAQTPCAAAVTGPGLSQSLPVSYANNTEVGTASASASYPGGANYGASSRSATFAITPQTTGYTFSGFYAPVSNVPTVNVVKAGKAIPVKFSLGGYFGLDIFESGYPRVAQFTCSSTAPTEPLTSNLSATANNLSYDETSGQYIYVWKTEQSWANSCRQLTLRFNDGITMSTAAFNFTR